MMRTLSRRSLLAVPFAVVMLCACLVGLAGCQSGPTAEELITQDLQTNFDKFKDPSSDLYAELTADLESANGDDLEKMGINASDYVASLLDGFDYAVESVDVDEDAGTAQANVTVTCKSLYRAMEDFGTAAEQYAAQYVADALAAGQTEADEAVINQEMGQLFVEAVDGAEIQDNDCVFTYTRDEDNAWSADDSAATELMSAMLGTPSSE